MPRKNVNGIEIPTHDNIYSTERERQDGKVIKVTQVLIKDIVDYPDYPFKVVENSEMYDLAESIAQVGVLEPALVRPKEDGTYEIIAGHRRKLASILADNDTIPCIVKNLTDDEATIIMVDTNLRQRENLLPSEKAWAYKMKLDILKRQGTRTDLTCVPLVHKLKARQIVAQEVGESSEQVRRYVRLTELYQPILDMVDENKIALRPAVEISYLSQKEQSCLLNIMEANECTPSYAQAI